MSDVYSTIFRVCQGKLVSFEVTEHSLKKNEKNRIASKKCDICTLDIMIDFHWTSETIADSAECYAGLSVGVESSAACM